MNPLANQLRWVIGIRMVVVTSAVLLHFLLQLTAPDADLRIPFLYPTALILYGASLVYLFLLQRFPRHLTSLAYIQFTVDLLVITALVASSGGVRSPFSMLYLVVISVAAALLRRRSGMFIAQVAWLLYAGLIIALYVAAPEAESINLLIYNLFSHLLGFAGVAILTDYLARNISRAEEELVAATANLEELEVVHRDVIESIASGLITTDLEGRIVGVNRAGTEILGKSETELLGQSVYESGLLSWPTWRELTAACPLPERVRAEGEIEKDGETLFVGYSVNELSDAQGQRKGYIVIYQDLTDWHRLQAEVQLKDRMAAVGELAAGIAHEIGNPLAAISGSVQMLSKNDEMSASTERLLGIIHHESQRLDRTIKSFLRFARPKDRSTSHFDVARLLRENVALLRNSEEITDRHEVDLELVPESAELYGDADQISQIFWNVTRNAIRAMPEGGTLKIVGALGADDYRIRFVDTGRGMAERERSNLFHPYHSLFDGGTGIGMAIVYRIVEEHGGRIEVDSAPEIGTTVLISLPRARPQSNLISATVAS